ncbi:MAG: peptide chain release factor 2 [Patescibacteria group bacterium]
MCRTIFDWEKKEARIQSLKQESDAPNFWDDPQKAGRVMQELEVLRQQRASFETIEHDLQSLEELSSLENLSESEVSELEKAYTNAENAVEEREWDVLLGGEYDIKSALLTIRSGAGGVDAQDWAEMLLRMYLRYCERSTGMRAKVIEESQGQEAGIKSATIQIEGNYAYGFMKGEAGIHRLVRLSPFNAKNLRQTSFASVEVMPVIEDDATVALTSDELRIDTYRASGAGGQHVNKTESAVRVTHIPTGIVAASQSERSQLQNKEEAMKMLRSKLAQRKIEEQEKEKQELRGEYKSAEWGNQIRSYVLQPYTLVKDHRTKTETSDAAGVLDGNIQMFIESELRFLNTN